MAAFGEKMNIEFTETRQESVTIGDYELPVRDTRLVGGIAHPVSVVDQVGQRHGRDKQTRFLVCQWVIDATDHRAHRHGVGFECAQDGVVAGRMGAK